MRVKVVVPVDLTEYPKLKLKELRYYIADSLRFERARTVEDNEEKINFSVGVFRSFWHWTLFSTIYGGEINFQKDTERILIVSRLSFTDTVVIASVLIGLMAHFNYCTSLAGEADFIFYIVTWFWIICGNMIISVYRWRRFIRQCVIEAADRVYLSREDLMANKRVQNRLAKPLGKEENVNNTNTRRQQDQDSTLEAIP
jgi:hypothetical protein